MNKGILITVLIFAASLPTLAQIPLHADDEQVFRYPVRSWTLQQDTAKIKYGQNRSFWDCSVLHFGVNANLIESGVPTRVITGSNYGTSYLSKIRINQLLSLIVDFGYERYGYKVRQDGNKIFADTLKHKREKIALHTLHGGSFVRINFDKLWGPRRGDHVGNFVDIGIDGSWNFFRRYVVKDKNEDEKGFTKRVIRNMNFIKKWQYGLKARLGFNRLMLYGRYRISDLVSQSQFNNTFLPRFTFGIGIGLY